jgi:hypothetical protein
MKLAAIPALALAGITAAAVPAMASTPQHHQVSTETFTSYGLQAGDGSHVRLAEYGVVDSHGSIDLTGSSQKGTIYGDRGNVYVWHSQGTDNHSAIPTSRWTCRETDRINGYYRVTGGTGEFWRADGGGSYTVVFTGVFRDSRRDRCTTDQNAQPLPGTSEVAFRASGALRVPGHHRS